MNGCVRDDCKHFLAGTLTEAEETGFVRHLEDCPQCKQWLESEAGDQRMWSLTKELLRGSVDTGSQSGAGAMHEESIADRSRQAYPELSFLAPSDDPAMLGRLGTYEIMGVLGRGGMGVVLKGFDRALNRNVALKVLDPVLANVAAARKRFAREARAMAAVSHEHVVPVYAVDEHGSLPYFVMEYVPGGTLERRLAHEGPLEATEVVRVGMQVALALAAAHRQGLVHRDIKPSNILLDQGTERVRVADFGLARAASDASFTRSGMLAGTPQYMAPEQVRGESCNAQSDLFSLGSLLYALCVGHAPFRGETVYAVMQRIAHDQPRSLREQNSAIPAWLEDFILRLLAKESRERFASADEVADVLAEELAHLQNPHVVMSPRRPWRRAARWTSFMRHGRKWLPVALIGLVVLAAGGGIGWWTRHSPPTATEHDAIDQSFSLSENQLPTVPLWGADGFDEIHVAATRLESNWRQSPLDAEIDPWRQSSQQLRQRVAELTHVETMIPTDNP